MRRRVVVLVGILAALGLGGYALWAGKSTGAPPAAVPASPVHTAVATLKDVPSILQGIGNVQAYYAVTVHSRVDGQLDQVFFREGQEVQSGDRLAQLDPRTFQAALDQAVAKKAQDAAQLANAQQDLRRYANLVAASAVTRQEYDTTRAQVAQDQATVQADDAAIESAQVQLGYTTIVSPIEGRVGIRQIDPGNIVHASDTGGIVVVTRLHPISLVFSLPEDTLPDIADAMAKGPVTVTASTRDGARQLDEGKLDLIDNQIDQTTGTVRLKATMPNQRGLLWPGQYVNAGLLLTVHRQVVTVPATALQQGEEGFYVYVVGADDTVQPRPVRVGQSDTDTAVVDEGLKAGETVVTEGQSRLQPGAKVMAQAVAAQR